MMGRLSFNLLFPATDDGKGIFAVEFTQNIFSIFLCCPHFDCLQNLCMTDCCFVQGWIPHPYLDINPGEDCRQLRIL